MAWAAVCIALPFLTKPAEAEQANRDGFSYVTTRMRYYVALESLMLPQSTGSKDLMEEFEAHVVDLYQHILEFQIKSVLRFYRSALGNFGRDLVQRDDWKQMLGSIKNLEKVVYDDSLHISTLSSRKQLENLAKSAEGSLEMMQRLLTTNEQQLQVGQEHRDISARQLSVEEQILQNQEAMSRRALSQEEEECLQLFRLQKNDGDDSYEWYKGRVEDRVEGTCQWFLNHDDFVQWVKQDSGLLLVSADPGCGKSVLSKHLIDHALPRSYTICYFFFKDQVQNTLQQALCALLHQLFVAKPSLIRHAIPEFSKNGSNLVNVTAKLWSILYDAGHDPEIGPTIFVLDALDECNESGFEALVRMLRDYFKQDSYDSTPVKFLLTSRPYEQITSEFEEFLDVSSYVIPGEEYSPQISQEVNQVITYRVNQLAKEKKLNNDVRNYLEQRLLKIPHRTYLWVYFVFDYLKQKVFQKTKKGVAAAIDTLPESVNQAYDKILSRSENPLKARKILSIILAAERPLTLKEMNIAVNIEFSPRSESMADLDLEEEEVFKDTIRYWCGLFISIYDTKVHFLHQTAREFLLARPSLLVSSLPNPQSWYGAISLKQANSVLAEICMTYLNFRDFQGGVSSGRGRLIDACDQICHEKHFLDYSANHWGAHYHHSSSEIDELTPIALQLCDVGITGVQTWFAVYWTGKFPRKPPPGLTALMIASISRLDGVVEALLKEGMEVDERSDDGLTALHFAVKLGHKAIAVLLLEAGAGPNIQDRRNRTPLHHATVEDHEAIVELLLSNGADVDSVDNNGSTALHYVNDQINIVRILLDGGADVNLQNDEGATAFHWAAINGNETIGSLLLGKGAQINKVNKDGRLALYWAVFKRHKGFVKLLLDEGVDINTKDIAGETPMDRATKEGDKAIIEMLKEYSARKSSE